MGPALRTQPDRRLVDLVRDGYDAAFEEIVRRYRRPLDRFAAAIVGGRSEDVTQDAFSKALLALRGTEAEIELRPWLYRIVRNTALNDLRDRPPEAAELSEALPGARSAAAEAEAREELGELTERLRALPEPQRAALVMRELEGLSHEEIAAALGVSGGAARQAIYRARAALREGLGLLVPMPVVRALAEHGDAATGGAIAASGAGGAALGGGAVKAGVATLLVAGAVGAGVAVDHRQGDRSGPEQAEAAPLVEKPGASGASGSGGGAGPGTSSDDSSGRGDGERRDRGEERESERGDDRDVDDRSGSEGGSRHSGSRHGSDDDRSGANSGPGSISGGRHSGDDDDGDDDHSGHGGDDDSDDNSGSGSGSSGSGDDGASGSGGESSGSGSSGDGDSSGPGSGEVEAEPDDPIVEEAPDDSSGPGGGEEGSGGEGDSGSGDLAEGG